MASPVHLASALLLSACASAPTPAVSLRATQGLTSKPCSACALDERCGEGGVCLPTHIRAKALLAAKQVPQLDMAAGTRERDRVKARRRIKASRTTLIVATGVLATGVAILVPLVAAAAPRNPGEDGDDGFAFLYGAIPASFAVLTMLVSGPVLLTSRHRLRTLAEPHRPTLRARPSVSASARGTQVGFSLDFRF